MLNSERKSPKHRPDLIHFLSDQKFNPKLFKLNFFSADFVIVVDVVLSRCQPLFEERHFPFNKNNRIFFYHSIQHEMK